MSILHPAFFGVCLQHKDNCQSRPRKRTDEEVRYANQCGRAQQQRRVHRMANPSVGSGCHQGAAGLWHGANVEVSRPVVPQGPRRERERRHGKHPNHGRKSTKQNPGNCQCCLKNQNTELHGHQESTHSVSAQMEGPYVPCNTETTRVHFYPRN